MEWLKYLQKQVGYNRIDGVIKISACITHFKLPFGGLKCYKKDYLGMDPVAK